MDASITDDFLLSPTAVQRPARSRPAAFAHFLLTESPYILMLMMGLGGIAYRSFAGHSILGYWLFLAPVYAGLCILGGLRHTHATQQVVDLVWMQGLQWFGFLAAMYILTLAPVRGTLNDNSIALMQLMMLALGTFVSGVNIRSWRIGIVGVILLFFVPIVGWIDLSSTLIILGMMTLLIVLGLFWAVERRVARRRPI